MPTMPSVVVLTHRFDPTADKVVEVLNGRGTPVLRFDTAEFPEALSAEAELTETGWTGCLRTACRRIDLDAISGLYYRRPTSFAFHPGMSAGEHRWASVQARMGFGGLLATQGPWLNHPHRLGAAEYKPVQLERAVAAGLLVPSTLLTNDPASARAFVRSAGRAVCKPFAGSVISDDTGPRHLYTTAVTEQQVDDSVARTMHQFQAWVPKDHEVRLTIVDHRAFAARIDAQSPQASVDWRSDYNAVRYSVVDVPGDVHAAVLGLMETLQLRFAAIDFVVDPEGRWWFLECNPNGQWAWIEDATGLPIASTIADALEGRGQ